MKKLDFYKVLDEANLYYGIEKCKLAGRDIRYVAPEEIPKIESNQVKAILRAMVDAVNDAIAEENLTIKERLEKKINKG